MVGQPHLADEDAAVLVGDGAPGAVDLVQLVPVDIGVGGALGEVGQPRSLDGQCRRVDPYARDTSLEPEAQHLLVLLAHGRVGPVEVGLPGGEQVEVPLAVRDPGPGAAPELAAPVVGRQLAAPAAPLTEVEEGPLGAAGPGGERGPEPAVLVGDVVGHDVDQGAQTHPARLADHLLGLGERAEGGVDDTVVGDVVTAVGHRREVPGREPQGVDAEFGKVGQPLADAGEIPGAVPVAVGEAADVHLVDDGRAPPVRGGLAAFHSGSFQLYGQDGTGLRTRRRLSPSYCPR